MAKKKMEIAGSHYPIDLSLKCGCRKSGGDKSFVKSNVSSSRPLPDLIPISLFNGISSSSGERDERNDVEHENIMHSVPFETSVVMSKRPNVRNFHFEDRRREKRELARFRSVPHLSANRKSSSQMLRKTLKSRSETQISSLTKTSICRSNVQFELPFSNTAVNVPVSFRHNSYLSICTESTDEIYKPEKNYANVVSNSSCHDSDSLTRCENWKQNNEDVTNEVTSSVQIPTMMNKYVKQGPGVSLSTIRSLRQLLDKRKLQQKSSKSGTSNN